MWIRLRLDIGWRDLYCGLWYTLFPGKRELLQQRVEEMWSDGKRDALACRSVRTGFDLLLRTLKLPAGSEVLMSAINLPDMVRIVREHDLVPVPVDVYGENLRLDLASLRRAVSPKSRVLVIAHLYGARMTLDDVLLVAQEHNLFVIEDCAQAYAGDAWRGDTRSQAALFSFGTIKTGTALGGALCRVQSPELLLQMREAQQQYPVQSTKGRLRQILVMLLLKQCSMRRCFGMLSWLARLFSFDLQACLANLTRGFPPDQFFELLRQRPSAAVLGLLQHRLQSGSVARVRQRCQRAQFLMNELGLDETQPELVHSSHVFWLFPYHTRNPDALIQRLQQAGFDATRRGRMEVLQPPPDHAELQCMSAAHLLDEIVFLPCYPEMPECELRRMAAVVRSVQAETS